MQNGVSLFHSESQNVHSHLCVAACYREDLYGNMKEDVRYTQSSKYVSVWKVCACDGKDQETISVSELFF